MSKHLEFVALASTLLAVTLLAACGRYFAPDINLDRYATDEEIVGQWTLTPQSLKDAQRHGYSPPEGTQHEIVFHLDGECEYRSITRSSPSWKCRYRDTRGAWTLQHDSAGISERNHKNLLFITFAGESMRLQLRESHGHIVLWETLGDPDSWEFLEYERAD